MKTKLSRHLPLLIVLGVTAVLYVAPQFSGFMSTSATDAIQEASAFTPVAVIPVTIGDVRETYQAIGTAAATAEIQLVAQVAGILDRVDVQVGSRVERGQVLAGLDERLLQAELAQAKANADRSTAELNRVRQLYESNIAEGRRLEEAQAQQRIDQAALEALQVQLSLSRFPSPFDGIVTGQFAYPGDTLRAGSRLFSLADVSNMRVLVKIPQTVTARLQQGANAELESETVPGEVLLATVTRIHPTSDPVSHQTIVELDAGNVYPQLHPGDLVKARLSLTERQQTLLLDRRIAPEAVSGGSTEIVLVRDGIAERRTVRLGLVLDSEVEILEGLDAGDLVVVRGAGNLETGDTVRIIGGSPRAEQQ